MSYLSKTQLLLVVGLMAFGSQTALANTNKNGTQITEVQSAPDAVFIKLAAGQTGEGCTANDWAMIPKVIDGADRPYWQQQVQIALAALLSGRTVDVNLHSCRNAAGTTTPTTYPVVRYITIK